MEDQTYKKIEVVGSSSQSLEEAISNALHSAGETLRNLDWFEVTEIRGAVDDRGTPIFQVGVKIGFEVER
jgi:hypothetical protein